MSNELFRDPDWAKATKKKKCCEGRNIGQIYEADNPCVIDADFDAETCDCKPGFGNYRICWGLWESYSVKTECDTGVSGGPVFPCIVNYRGLPPYGCEVYFDIKLVDIVISSGTERGSCGSGGGGSTEYCPVLFILQNEKGEIYEACSALPLRVDSEDKGDQPCGVAGLQRCSESKTLGGWLWNVFYYPDGDNLYNPNAREYALGWSQGDPCGELSI